MTKKILFVCRANVGRSQVGMEFYNQLHPGMADSAGTKVDNEGELLSQRFGAISVVEAMRQAFAIDMSDNRRTQLTPEMLNNYDKVIVMAEPENTPDYLAKSPKFVYWEMKDIKGTTVPEAIEICTLIKQKVAALD